MMEYVYTNDIHPDFILLCQQLDMYLNLLAGGEEKRCQYIPHNQLKRAKCFM